MKTLARKSNRLFALMVFALISVAISADDDKTAFHDVEGELSVMVLGSGDPIHPMVATATHDAATMSIAARTL